MPALLTVSKRSSAGWDAVLPPVIEALGGATAALEASGLPATDAASTEGGTHREGLKPAS